MATANLAKLNSKQRTHLNGELSDLCKGMHDAIPLADMAEIVGELGIELEEGIMLCGRDGRATIDLYAAGAELESVLVLTWHKFETGRYEVVAYVS